ncbi:hypothetical protein HYW83_01645 [Candidatus Peregrinibacteria bacterium]|nr:hypothetical protein [Candidatus Peregrinibacteria bacterium]
MAEEIKITEGAQAAQNGNGNGNGKSDVFTGLAVPQMSAAPASQTPSISNLLGPKPLFSRTAYEEKEAGRRKIAKITFVIAILAALGTYGFFQSQLNPDFTWFADQLGPNAAKQFEAANNELKAKQTELNLIRFRTARLWLDEANSQIDPYQAQIAILDSDFSTRIEKDNARVQQQILGAKLKNSLSEVQKILSKPFGVNLYTQKPVLPEENDALFESLLKEALTKQKTVLSGGDIQGRGEVRAIDNVIRLVDNKKFREAILKEDLGKIREEDFSKMLSRIRSEGTDELSLIDRVKRRRLDWAEVIQNIHSVTRQADAKYGQGLFKIAGGFLFNSYRFDAKSRRISITGLTKTPDSKTFTFIANLVDAVEKSTKFKDIDFRSFSKSRDEKGDFSSSVNLEFALQEKDEKDPRDGVPQLENQPTSAPTISSPSS